MTIEEAVVYVLWAIAFIVIGYTLGELYRRTKKIQKNIDKIMKHLKIE